MKGNIYYWGAKPGVNEETLLGSSTFNPDVKLEEKEGNVYLSLVLDQQYYDFKGVLITTEVLGKTRVTKTLFENTDGTSLKLDKDYFCHARSAGNAAAGPFVDLGRGITRIKVW